MQGKHEITLQEGVHRIKTDATFPLLISLDDQPVRATSPGSQRFIVRGAGKLSIDPSEPKKPYGFNVLAWRPSQKGEQLDDIPPPDPAPPANYLQAMRQKIRQQMGVIREDFNARPSIYELGDAEPLFEEQEAALQKQAKANALAESNDAAQASSSTEPEGTSRPAEKSAEPSTPPTD